MSKLELLKLKSTLSDQHQDEASHRCLEVLSDERLMSGKTLLRLDNSPLNIERAREVYKDRAQMNAALNKSINGYDTLIPRLESATCDVCIHTVATEHEYFVIFTDPTHTVLFGILSSQSGHVFRYFQNHPENVFKVSQ